MLLATLIFSQLAWAAENENGPQTCEEILRSIEKINFDTVYADTERHPALRQLAQIYNNRSSPVQTSIDASLTESHLRKEMSFQVRNPLTGLYDKFVAVPVVGHIAPILQRDYNNMVQSTGPVLRALRALLQKVYSTSELTRATLGLEDLPDADADIVIRVLKDSIYREPALMAPQMKDYPFLAVSGFDGAIVDPRKPKNVFFEMNLGTPSGLANNLDLLEDLRRHDPAVYHAVESYLPAEKTFLILRETIERNARAWTNKTGISVVISPGVYNGAHPDVAAIARRSGMPLVMSRDLYEDVNGNIRLNRGPLRDHPVVTGIYNRMEESFLLQSSALGIPLVSPAFEDVRELSARTGLTLRAGAIYKWIRDDSGKIVDVERGAAGEPLLEEVWDTLGRDPERPESQPGSFARAVLKKQLYVSNIGGRLVDDKRLFRIVSEHLAAKRRGGIAKPVKGLAPDRLRALFKNPAQFVVKDPANSGGVGIYFLGAMKDSEREDILAKVRANPGQYEIQYISPLVTLPHASLEDYAGVVIDLRLFVMMDEQGEVNAGPNSMLLRTAGRGNLKSNTSAGGGYGIGVVLQTRATSPRDLNPRTYLSRPSVSEMETAHGAVKHTGELYTALIDASEDLIDASEMRRLKDLALGLSFELRALLASAADERVMPSRLRDFAQNERADMNSVAELIRYLELMFRNLRFGDGSYAEAFRDAGFRNENWYDRLQRRLENPTSASYSPLNAKIRYKDLASPVVAYYWDKGSQRHEKYEMAEILSVQDDFIQNIIDDVRASGGEVRMMKRRLLREGRHFGWAYESPYFWVNLSADSPSYLKPVIGIDLTGDRGLPALAHEYEHFKLWRGQYRLLREQGLDHEAATKAAVDYVWQKDMIVVGERLAVNAEMAAEREHGDSIFSQSQGLMRPRNFWERGYTNRVLYPEFEAVRKVLHSHRWNSEEPMDDATLNKYMRELVMRATDQRQRALEYLTTSPDARLSLYWQNSSLMDLLAFPYGIERLQGDDTVALFEEHLARVCREVLGDAERCP